MQRRTIISGLGAIIFGGLAANHSAAASQGKREGQGMIIVTVEVEFEDDGIQEKLDAIRNMDEATAAEEGCIAYKTSFDANNPRIMRIHEMWESMEMLIPHFSTPHIAEFQKALAGLKAKGMDAKVYEVARELPFPN